jgi:hypothetical protein
MSNKVKIAGYAKKEVFNGNIEYRDFTPDLVGLQLTSDRGTPLFTMGNFSITTNMDPKTDKTFITNNFSDFISLDDLDLTVAKSETLLVTNTSTILNLDKKKIKNYTQFSSLVEFVRVSLENIILKWPASLNATPFYTDGLGNSITGPSFSDYSYNFIEDVCYFKINVNFLKNSFNINFLNNGTISDTFNEYNDLRNITVNYDSYVILLDNLEYDVVGFTGSTELVNDYVYLKVKGDVFNGKTQYTSYHIKPKKIIEDEFFNSLPNFESYLLNRLSLPKFKASFFFSKKTDSGATLLVERDLIWPISDGYNIDFQTGDYISYASNLIDIAQNSDVTETNLMNRLLVSESISSFDTTPVFLDEEDLDTSGQKVNKTLNIYGLSFDEINKYITGISFANTVTYDKSDNTPDKYLKNLAKLLGWDTISSVLENNLLSNYVKTSPSNYAGQSEGLTPVQADIELWRRLILNSPWIWKSKGARKSIEFLLRFIGTPNGLVTFNEYVYKADSPIDIEMFISALELNNLDTDLSLYPIDSEGYPKLLPDTENMYFQNDGLWYRETGGSGATIDILTGNNPHVGPYDGGNKYINQLRVLVPNFSAVTLTSETVTTDVVKLFTNYGLGEITRYTGGTYIEATHIDGSDLSKCVVVKTDIIKDVLPTTPLSLCGCPCEGDDEMISICIEKTTPSTTLPCETLVSQPTSDTENGYYIFDYYQYNQDRSLFSVGGVPITNTSKFTSKECCKALNGLPTYTEIYNPSTVNVDSGYVCCINKKCGCAISCDWLLNQSPVQITQNDVTDSYCEFKTLNGYGSKVVVTSDGSNCPSNWTTPTPNVTDPNTGLVGFGCKITTLGFQEYDKLSNYFLVKSNGGYKDFTCCSFTYDVYTQFVNIPK